MLGEMAATTVGHTYVEAKQCVYDHMTAFKAMLDCNSAYVCIQLVT